MLGTLTKDALGIRVHSLIPFGGGSLADSAAGGVWPGADNITRSAWLDGSADYLSRSSVTGTSTRKWSVFGAFRVTDFSARSRYIFECASGTSSQTALLLRSEQDLQFFDYSGGGLNATVLSDGLIRDSEWYTFLCVCDTANSTAAHRWRLYVNSVEQSTSRTNPSLNYDTAWNNGTSQHIGVQSYSSLQNYWEGSFAAFLHADNTALTPSDVLSSDTVGTNGTVYYPKSEADLKALADAGGTASFLLASDIGDGTDDSSKGNNFTASSMSDSANGSADTPTDPWPVFNSLQKSAVTATLSEGGRRVSLAAGTGWLSTTQLVSPTGKYYVELKANTVTASEMAFGVCNPRSEQDASPRSSGFLHWEADGDRYLDGSQTATEVTAWAATNVVGLGINMDDKQLLFYDKDGNLDATVAFGSNVDGSDGVLLYLGNLSSSGAQDATLIIESADMTHGLPTGYSALKTQSLPAPSAQGVDVFQTILYSGTGSTQSITGAGFQPDLIWGKDRAASSNFELYDSSRGTTKVIYSSSSTSEGTVSGVTAFNSDGFSLGSDAGINASGNNQVAWCWKANAGTTSSNGDGDISSTVQVGDFMSIVQYTGYATARQTVGHGLGAAPDMIITKNRDASTVALAWFNSFNAQYLNLTNTSGVSSGIYGSTMNSTVFEVESNSEVNGSGNNMIAYCFKNLPGVCQVGKYIGNGDADGPMLNLGFEGRWIVIKTSSTGGWACFDTARDTAQPLGNWLQLDSAAAESTTGLTVDALATGFKVRDTHSWLNSSGTTYHYIAFADVATGIGLPPILGK